MIEHGLLIDGRAASMICSGEMSRVSDDDAGSKRRPARGLESTPCGQRRCLGSGEIDDGAAVSWVLCSRGEVNQRWVLVNWCLLIVIANDLN